MALDVRCKQCLMNPSKLPQPNCELKLDFGKWEIELPPKDNGECRVDHMSKLKLVIKGPDGQIHERFFHFSQFYYLLLIVLLKTNNTVEICYLNFMCYNESIETHIVNTILSLIICNMNLFVTLTKKEQKVIYSISNLLLKHVDFVM